MYFLKFRRWRRFRRFSLPTSLLANFNNELILGLEGRGGRAGLVW